MPVLRILPAAAANGVIALLDAPNRAARLRGTGGSAIAQLSPETWGGAGSAPIGWTLPCGTLFEPGGNRVAIISTDAFASGKSEFSGAVSALPGDWGA
jgi:hypothetical protein